MEAACEPSQWGRSIRSSLLALDRRPPVPLTGHARTTLRGKEWVGHQAAYSITSQLCPFLTSVSPASLSCCRVCILVPFQRQLLVWIVVLAVCALPTISNLVLSNPTFAPSLVTQYQGRVNQYSRKQLAINNFLTIRQPAHTPTERIRATLSRCANLQR